MYQALYRQWRPQVFAELVGQEHVARTLQNALEQERLAHAYLFCGPRGTGKTSVARILAKAINCEAGPAREPCNLCAACLGIQAGRVMDVLEIDAASNRGIDDIRELREKVRYAPVEVRYKVAIIDEAHMLSQEAFNALLKTLEDPPSRVLFVLATTEPHKLPATIVSRCQRLDFHLIGIAEIAERLRSVARSNGRTISEDAVYLLAEEANGGLRDALSLLEQVLAYSSGEVEQEDVLAVLGAVGRDVFHLLTEALLRRDLSAALFLLDDVAVAGKDLYHFTQQAVRYYRDLMVVLACGKEAERLNIGPDWLQPLTKQAEALGMGTIGGILAELHGLLAEVRWTTRPRLLWELTIFRLFLSGGGAAQLAPEANVVTIQSAAAEISRPEQSAAATEKIQPLPSLTRMWPRVMELLKKESVKTHALLLSGDVGFRDGSTLEVRYEAQIHCEMMDSPENKKPLQAVLKEVFGVELAVCCVKVTNGSGAVTVEKDPEEMFSSAVEIFHGQVIDELNR
ncbi:MAG: DNA polymerase III subunit gamma/tau [Clostridium sp.]|nr:DNA polymerase III subunit gamma/tau [Clostridium sp.]